MHTCRHMHIAWQDYLICVAYVLGCVKWAQPGVVNPLMFTCTLHPVNRYYASLDVPLEQILCSLKWFEKHSAGHLYSRGDLWVKLVNTGTD